MACNCSGNKTGSTKPTVACPKCNAYKTSKTGAVVCAICKNIFYVKQR